MTQVLRCVALEDDTGWLALGDLLHWLAIIGSLDYIHDLRQKAESSIQIKKALFTYENVKCLVQ